CRPIARCSKEMCGAATAKRRSTSSLRKSCCRVISMRQTSLQLKPRHFKLTIAYDGTQYAGWQLQPNGETVQEVVEGAHAKIAGRDVRVHGSGLTDAGVHARGQAANCTLRTQLKVPTLLKALNANLPEDVRVLRLQ